MLIMLSLVDVRFFLGDTIRTFLSAEDQCNLVEYYQTTYPNACVIPHDTDTDAADANFLLSQLLTHKHLVLDGCRILPSESLSNTGSSIIQVGHNMLASLSRSFLMISLRSHTAITLAVCVGSSALMALILHIGIPSMNHPLISL